MALRGWLGCDGKSSTRIWCVFVYWGRGGGPVAKREHGIICLYGVSHFSHAYAQVLNLGLWMQGYAALHGARAGQRSESH